MIITCISSMDYVYRYVYLLHIHNRLGYLENKVDKKEEDEGGTEIHMKSLSRTLGFRFGFGRILVLDLLFAFGESSYRITFVSHDHETFFCCLSVFLRPCLGRFFVSAYPSREP